MFAKVVALIAVAGCTAAGLLALRQSRIQAASELAAARLQIVGLERELQRVRSEIAERTTPAEIAALIDHTSTYAAVRGEPGSAGSFGSPVTSELPSWAVQIPPSWSLTPASQRAQSNGAPQP